jgi:hypothetical protein
MYRWIIAVGAGLLVLAALSGWGRSPAPGGAEQPDAARAVRALVSAPAATAARALPADFAATMGYAPVVEGAVLVRADGGCSSPFGGTGYGFDAACRHHDLGYDLLRYAQRKQAPLGAWARHAVDADFAATMAPRCGGPLCRATARGYWAAVAFNSWRQGYGTPVVEDPRSFAPGAMGGFATVLALGLGRPTTRRRDRLHRLHRLDRAR